MRVLLSSMLLLLLTACGDDSRATSPEARVTVNGVPYDLGRMQADAERANVLLTRPLTTADVERYLASLPDWRKVGSRSEEWSKVVKAHGLGVSEWITLHSRITAAFMVLKVPNAPIPEKNRGDADVVRPYVDRIEAALNSR